MGLFLFTNAGPKSWFGRNFSLIRGDGSGSRYYRNSPPPRRALPSEGVLKRVRFRMSRTRRVSVAAFAAAICALVFTSLGAAAESPHQIGDSDLQPTSTKFGHPQTPHVGARTIQHWWGQTTNPVDGATYTYSMVGADPATESAASIYVDIVPVNVT